MAPYDTNELLKRSQALLDQTKAQGATPFAGSSFDTPEAQQLAKTDPVALANFQKANPGLSFDAQELAHYNAATPFDGTKINAQGIQNLPQAEAEASTIQKQIAERKALQEQYLAQAQPTTEETTLETQLADIRAKSEQGLIGTRYDIQALPTEGISATGIAARGRELTTEEGRRQEIMASQEKLLSTRLGIAEKKRKTKMDILKEAAGFKKEDIDVQVKIQESIERQNKAVQDQVNKLSDDSRQALTTILSQFKGLDYSDLDQASQLQVQKLATQSGVPVGVIVSGMKAVKDQMLANEAQENRRIAISAQNSGSIEKSNLGNDISNRLFSSKKGGQYVDGNVYLEQRRRYTEAGLGTPAEFDTNYKNELSPEDRKKYQTDKSGGEDDFDNIPG